MSVKVNYNVRCDVVETLETGVDGLSADKEVKHDAFNSQATLNSGTTPPVTKVASFTMTMTGGADDIQFDSLTGVNGATVDGTGLKVQVIKIKNKVGNSVITIAPKAAENDYLLLGASFTFKLLTGQEITLYGNDATPDIGAGDAITVTGTSSDEVEVIVVMG